MPEIPFYIRNWVERRTLTKSYPTQREYKLAFATRVNNVMNSEMLSDAARLEFEVYRKELSYTAARRMFLETYPETNVGPKYHTSVLNLIMPFTRNDDMFKKNSEITDDDVDQLTISLRRKSVKREEMMTRETETNKE